MCVCVCVCVYILKKQVVKIRLTYSASDIMSSEFK